MALNLRRIWLLQDGESLPIDQKPRLMRTGHLAEKLVAAGYSVTWWTSRFNHSLKRYREFPDTLYKIDDRYRIYMLDGPSYKKNISFARIRHYRSLAANFTQLADSLERPGIILASYPSPELCFAGMRFANKYGISFIIDVRDPWPDIFPEYFSPHLRWSLFPVLFYYRRKFRSIVAGASGVLAVSNAMLEWALGYSGRARSDKDRVFYIGYDLPTVPTKIEIPEKFSEQTPLKCLFVSTCGRSYDGSTLIEAARLLEKWGERRIRFIVTGDGEMRSKWVTGASELRTVTFTGWISHEELESHLAEGHVGLILMHGGITSFWLGNKFGEYLSAFLALINNVPGEPADIIRRHALGLNIPPRDPAALAVALRNVVNAPERVMGFMENSRDVFFKEFERGQLYEKYLAYLRQHLEGKGGLLVRRQLPANME